ncbi:hypothetical protein KUCAC02_026190 [Chaenocephalus aceratus]|uniref:Uncharacterized protein n=1 Tax=Chaenocephalus aceratus TaxID=36190 RepID=A0ACB9VX36_CHAAC|nr:hypothetical protein KUCAC02_026190 [Chaenocephalus aceratus]
MRQQRRASEGFLLQLAARLHGGHVAQTDMSTQQRQAPLCSLWTPADPLPGSCHSDVFITEWSRQPGLPARGGDNKSNYLPSMVPARLGGGSGTEEDVARREDGGRTGGRGVVRQQQTDGGQDDQPEVLCLFCCDPFRTDTCAWETERALAPC